MSRLRLTAAVCATMFYASTASGVLVNRYTFNEGNANDSVGTQHGMVVDPSGVAKFVGGQLDLTANNGVFSNTPDAGAYVNLPNGIVTAALGSGQPNAASFEVWATIQENRFWARLFDFGSSNLGEDTSVAGGEQDYLMMVPLGFATEFAFESHPAFMGGSVLATGTPLTVGVEHHIVVTYNQGETTAERPGGTARVYLDNALIATGPVNPAMPLGSLTNENNDWIGRSQWNDPLIDGFINEFRIYDHALSAAEVTASNAAGPVPPPFPTLVVNRDTGTVTIQNSTSVAQQLTRYSITSAAAGLDAGSWDAIAPANGWTIQSQTSTALTEMGGTPVNLSAGGGSNAIGAAWVQSPFEDLAFTFTLSGGTTGQGAVQYVGNGGAAFKRSDLDTDGDIDVTDWVAYLDGNGDNLAGLGDVAQYLKGDLNSDNVNNHADFVLFRSDFIAVNGAAAFAALPGAVPEPMTLTLSVLGAIVFTSQIFRRRPR